MAVVHPGPTVPSRSRFRRSRPSLYSDKQTRIALNSFLFLFALIIMIHPFHSLSAPTTESFPMTRALPFNRQLSDVNLVIMFNHRPDEATVLFLANLYSPLFADVSFVGPDPQLSETAAAASGSHYVLRNSLYVVCKNDYKGFFSYDCLAQVMKLVPAQVGYLFNGDDVGMNITALARHPLDHIWVDCTFQMFEWDDSLLNRAEFLWWSVKLPMLRNGQREVRSIGYEALKDALSSLDDDALKRLYGEEPVTRSNPNVFVGPCPSDTMYLPARFRKDFFTLARHFRHQHVFLEIAFPHILKILRGPGGQSVVLSQKRLWDQEREYARVAEYINAGDLELLHPIKPSADEGKRLLARITTGSSDAGH